MKRFVTWKNHVPQNYFTIKQYEKRHTATWNFAFLHNHAIALLKKKERERETALRSDENIWNEQSK